MNSIISIIFSTAFAISSPKIWDIGSFITSCNSNGGKITETVDAVSKRLECKVRDKEMSSAWFGEKGKMQGWLEYTRNTNQNVILSREFDSAGILKKKSLFIWTASKPKESIQNMFVFDKDDQVIRGNITISNDTFVVVPPDLIFRNGTPSTLKDLSGKLKEHFSIDQSVLHKQIEQIWNQQNFPPSPSVPLDRGSQTVQ